eukprot:GHVO01068524.1.p1 GENE.GHVO01068524.1~~GHVO01068524.1.p1  ORF type:complete len:835 (-),score=183.67 GHVO01068524.1:344-2848(-)
MGRGRKLAFSLDAYDIDGSDENDSDGDSPKDAEDADDYESRRRRRPESKESQIYGVFFDNDDDDDSGERKRHRKKKELLKAPMLFVTRGVQRPDEVTRTPLDEEANDGRESEEDTQQEMPMPQKDDDTRFNFSGKPERREPEDAAPAWTTTRMKKEYGVGFKMLQKMGFSGGGLGKKGEGIAAPIQVKMRSKNKGLAETGERTSSHIDGTDVPMRGDVFESDSAVDIILGSDHRGHDGSERGQRKRYVSHGWKRGAHPKRIDNDMVRRLAKEHEAAAEKSGVGRIIDMRGPDAVIVEDITSLRAQEEIEQDLPLDGLLYDLRNQNKIMQRKLGHECQRIETQKNRLNYLNIEIDQKKGAIDSSDRDIAAAYELVGELEAMFQKFGTGEVDDDSADCLAHDGNIRSAVKGLQMLYCRYGRASRLIRLPKLSMAVASKLYGDIVDEWDPLEHPQYILNDTLREWIKYIRSIEPDGIVDFFECTKISSKIREAVDQRWDVACDLNCTLLHLVDILELYLLDTEKKAILIPLIKHHIHQKLIRAIANWDTDDSSIGQKLMLHQCILPWWPHMRDELEALAPTVRHKLSEILQHASWDSRIANEVLEWKAVWKPREFDSFVFENITPRIRRNISVFEIRPDKQDLKALEELLCFMRVLGVGVVQEILEIHFFPKWLQALRQWLMMPDADLEEITIWYEGWKELFHKHGMADAKGVQMGFQKGLQMITDFLDSGEQSIKAPKGHKIPIGSLPLFRRAATVEVDDSLSVQELLEDLAANNDFSFRPKPGRFQNGKQVYGFGPSTCYVARGVVYILNQSANTWDPCSSQELVLRAKSASRPT